MSLRLAILNAYLRRVERPALARMVSGRNGRIRLERNAARFFRDVPGIRYRRFKTCQAPIVTGQIAVPTRPKPRTAVLYIHGGGYAFGSSETHRRLAGAIARECGADVYVPDYALAPEAPFPAGLNDCVATFTHMFDQGYHHIALVGDSAGGGMVFGTLAYLIRNRLPLPYACVGLSAWTNLTLASDSLRRNDRTEVTLPPSRMADTAAAYLGDTPADHPFASPVFAQFTGAPPCLLHVSDCEILEDDTHDLADVLRRDGADVTVRTWEKTPHVWHLYHGNLPEADEAITDVADFLKLHDPDKGQPTHDGAA